MQALPLRLPRPPACHPPPLPQLLRLLGLPAEWLALLTDQPEEAQASRDVMPCFHAWLMTTICVTRPCCPRRARHMT